MLFKIDNKKLFLICARMCIGTSEITKIANLSTVTFQRICKGKPLSSKTIGKIAKALGVTPEEIIA